DPARGLAAKAPGAPLRARLVDAVLAVAALLAAARDVAVVALGIEQDAEAARPRERLRVERGLVGVAPLEVEQHGGALCETGSLGVSLAVVLVVAGEVDERRGAADRRPLRERLHRRVPVVPAPI